MFSPSDRFRENLRAASQIKLDPSIWFSPDLAAYVRHLSSYEQVHSDAMAISLLNIVAITCRNSWILRRGESYVPLNLYNLVVGKSGKRIPEDCTILCFRMKIGYGKSDILSRVERGVKQCVNFHREKFITKSSNLSTETALDEKSKKCMK